MSKQENSEGFDVVALVAILTTIALAIGVWPFIIYNREFRRCVQLEVGINLGYNAIFDLRRPYLKPYGVPKLSDGTPLFDQPSWSVFVTETTVYGRTFGTSKERAFEYVWRTDKGLVREKDNLGIYKMLIAQAGKANVGLKRGSLDVDIVMRELMKRPEYADQKCSTQLIAW